MPQYRDARGLLRTVDNPRSPGKIISGDGLISFGTPPPRGAPLYTFPMASQMLDSNSTAVTINNSTTQTTLVSVAAPALTVRSQGATRLSAVGTIENLDASTGDVTWRVKVSDGTTTSTVLATSAVAVSTSANQRWWNLDAVMYGAADNAQVHWGSLSLSSPTTSTLAASTYSTVGYSTSGLDDLQAMTITVTAQLTQASTDFTLTMESAMLEAIT